MAKEPWEEDIYDYGEEDLKRTKKSSDELANKVVVAMVCLLIFLSTGGSN